MQFHKPSLRPKRPPEPTDANGFLDRGDRLGRNGLYELAIAAYGEAIKRLPGFAEAHYNRGCSFYELRRYEEAIADLTRAIDLNPNEARYYAQRSLVHLFSDSTDLAQADEDTCEDLRNRGYN